MKKRRTIRVTDEGMIEICNGHHVGILRIQTYEKEMMLHSIVHAKAFLAGALFNHNQASYGEALERASGYVQEALDIIDGRK